MNCSGRSKMQLLAHLWNLEQQPQDCDVAVLDRIWTFQYSSQHSPEHNVYEFFDQLEQWRSYCRRWHVNNGGDTDLVCTLERIRNDCMLPKIREFMTELKPHL